MSEIHSHPVSLPILIEWVELQNLPCLHDSISKTWGEPLLHAPFLREFLPQIRSGTGFPIYLVTGGHRITNSHSDDFALLRFCPRSHYPLTINPKQFCKAIIKQKINLMNLWRKNQYLVLRLICS
ncbi:radical SAM domain-containing protein [Tolypothrix sp. NIES-4075]|nr:radical SAM domain-containing protein [Tolypothrix sp. NIES-4075]